MGAAKRFETQPPKYELPVRTGAANASLAVVETVRSCCSPQRKRGQELAYVCKAIGTGRGSRSACPSQLLD